MATDAERSLIRPGYTTDDASTRRDHPGCAHRLARPAVVALVGYAGITIVLLGIGMLLTHGLDGTVGRWDEQVNEYFARRRTTAWNDITGFATAAFNTVPVVVAAAIVVGVLAVGRRFREALFLTLALLIEITTFLSVTFIVARPRPDVVRLNSTPSTSSFPSGHTAAATVLFVGIAIIVGCCTSNVLARVGAGLLGAVVVFAVGFGRVYRGLHHPTDVFVGAVFGLACLFVSLSAVRAYTNGPAPSFMSEGPSEGPHRHLEDARAQ